jgi:pSer/pThr/pTyr-binding forkhead associated (FHA) protein
MDESSPEFLAFEETEAFAKLEGPSYKQFITKLIVFLGRDANSTGSMDNEEQILFVGDSQKISRKHVKIYWNSSKGDWEIQILSKNKVIVNGSTYRKSDAPVRLPPCSAIKIDKYKFYFFPAIRD